MISCLSYTVETVTSIKLLPSAGRTTSSLTTTNLRALVLNAIIVLMDCELIIEGDSDYTMIDNATEEVASADNDNQGTDIKN